MIVYLETNWVVSVVYEQDADARSLLSALRGRCRLCLPEFCLAEAIVQFQELDKRMSRFRDQHARELHGKAAGMKFPEAQAFAAHLAAAFESIEPMVAQWNNRLDALFPEFGADIEMLAEAAVDMQRSVELARDHGLGRGDAVILAVVLRHAEGARDSGDADLVFLSGDKKAYGRGTSGGALLNQLGIKHFPTAGGALGWARSRLTLPH